MVAYKCLVCCAPELRLAVINVDTLLSHCLSLSESTNGYTQTVRAKILTKILGVTWNGLASNPNGNSCFMLQKTEVKMLHHRWDILICNLSQSSPFLFLFRLLTLMTLVFFYLLIVNNFVCSLLRFEGNLICKYLHKIVAE